MKALKRLNLLLVAAAITGLGIIASCSKDRVEPEQTQKSSYESSDDYFSANKPAEQDFEITQDGPGPIVGNMGTKVWAAKEKLMFANGDSVHYPYTVKLVELYTPKDMIYYQMPSTSGLTLLTTAGEVRVRAFKDGQELVLRPTMTWTVEIPNAAPIANMLIYYGAESGSTVNWVNTPAGNFDITSYGYTGDIAQLGWVNCAKATSALTTATFTISSTTDNLDNVAKFFYFPNLKCLKQLTSQTASNLPVGESVKIILIGISSGTPYTYYSNITVAQDSTFDVSLTASSDAALTSLLDGLGGL